MLDRPPPVPVSHSLGGGTVGQVSLKALAAKVLRCPKAVYQPGQLQDPCTEPVPLSRTSRQGTAGQALEWDTDDWRGFFEERAAIAEHTEECCAPRRRPVPSTAALRSGWPITRRRRTGRTVARTAAVRWPITKPCRS